MFIKIHKKSEWFEFEKPIGEPDYEWEKFNGKKHYFIERMVKPNGDIVWFGMGTNWLKEPGKQWTVLATNCGVKPREDGVYPSERSYFAPCDIPVYEKLYMEMKEK